MKPTCGYEGCGQIEEHPRHYFKTMSMPIDLWNHAFQPAAQAEKEVPTDSFNSVPMPQMSECKSANPASGEDSLSGAGAVTQKCPFGCDMKQYDTRCLKHRPATLEDAMSAALKNIYAVYGNDLEAFFRDAKEAVHKRPAASSPVQGAGEAQNKYLLDDVIEWNKQFEGAAPGPRELLNLFSQQPWAQELEALPLNGKQKGFLFMVLAEVYHLATPETGRGEREPSEKDTLLGFASLVTGMPYFPDDNPSCHVCGEILTPTGLTQPGMPKWQCLSCGASTGMSARPVKYQNCRKPDAHGLIYGFCNHVECVPIASTGVSEPRKEEEVEKILDAFGLACIHFGMAKIGSEDEDKEGAKSEELRSGLLKLVAELRRESAGLRRRVHYIEGHNQYFERCESAWCNPASDSNPALESVKQLEEIKRGLESELASAREELEHTEKMFTVQQDLAHQFQDNAKAAEAALLEAREIMQEVFCSQACSNPKMWRDAMKKVEDYLYPPETGARIKELEGGNNARWDKA